MIARAVERDSSFRALGSQARVLCGGPSTGSVDPTGSSSSVRVREMMRSFEASLSRFRQSSELSALNRSTEETVPASPLLRTLVRAARWAAEESGGLIDPTLADPLEALGYDRSIEEINTVALADAVNAAPPRTPARPDRSSRWREIEVDDEAGTVTRPVGVRIDPGAVGKGLAADAAAELLGDRARFCVSLGGDIRTGGPEALARPYPVVIEDPFGGEPIARLNVGSGGLATSGLSKRVWRRDDGGLAHHMLDPSTGTPAWTGLLQVTALAATALEAETLAKRVLLGGPEAIHLLDRHGGVVVRDDCSVELVGPIASTQAVDRPPATT